MLRATLVALLVATIGLAGFAAPAAAAGPVPRVALVVGPVGALTSRYRALADEAAAAARRAGAEVVTVYSPNATWPAVKEALTGASIVVYLGHGNGWPSRYRDSPYPATQNGFGLNPVAGRDDGSHQYFGEASVGKIKLAPNAVVVLSHLCYASGNTEPGLAEGTQSDAVQRVDNFAAGFLRAGARAVVAEAYQAPAYYVRSLLAGRGSVESIWAVSPTALGAHPVVATSVRTPGYTLHLDPKRADGGYVRSLVSNGGLTAAEVRAGAMGSAATPIGPTVVTPPPEPSLIASGARFSQPAFRNLPVAASLTRLQLPLAAGTTKLLPAGAGISVRWDPLELDAPAAPAATPAPAPTTAPDAAPPASPDPEPVAPEVDLVVAEQLGSVVEPARAGKGARGLWVDIAFPAAPGLYRFTVTLHTPGGVAYDAATQALLTPLLVRVRPAIAVAYGAPATLTVTSGAEASVPLRVVNAGSQRWDLVVTAAPSRIAGEPGVAARTTIVPPRLVATWVSAAGAAVPAPTTVRLDDALAAPGGSAALSLGLTAPAAPGEYLLLLDVVSASAGPLSSLGSDPAIVRVTVDEPPAPAPPPVGPGRADGA